MTAILVTLLFVLSGCAIVQFQLPRKNPIVRLWLGASLGMLMLMVLPALCAHLLTFSVMAHYAAAGILLAAVLMVLLNGSWKKHHLCPHEAYSLLPVLKIKVLHPGERNTMNVLDF